jgi:hypothetical protein
MTGIGRRLEPPLLVVCSRIVLDAASPDSDFRRFIVFAVYFDAHDSEIALRSLQRIGFESETERWHSNRGFDCALALKPSKRYCRVGSSYLMGSSAALKANLKSMNAGIVSASIAGQRGWSMIAVLVICSVAVFLSSLNVRPLEGTGVTQYRPSGEMGGWKSWVWFAATAGPLNTVSQVWEKIASCD